MPSRRILVAGLPLIATLSAANLLFGQTIPPPQVVSPAFEVASIRLHIFVGSPGECMGSGSGTRVTLNCLSLRNLIMRAWNVKTYQVSGGPAWLQSMGDATYDVTAKAPGDVKPTAEQVRTMLQALLADRFQLRLHHDTKELPVYALVIDRNGPKLKESSPDAKSLISFDVGGTEGQLTFSKLSMAQFAPSLSQEAGRPGLDKTGLTGFYDFSLKWTRDQPQVVPGLSEPSTDSATPQTSTSGPSLFTALQEQLGLKLEPQKAPIEMLVIDQASRPSGN